MTWQQRYKAGKEKLLGNQGICAENRELFAKFFEYEEYKLKRINRAAELDEASYKTVYCYITRLCAVNRWFENKPWRELTKEDIKRVYDALEDGIILTLAGKPFKDKDTYYHRILRGKPFMLAGKRELVTEVMEFHIPARREEPRFLREETFRQILGVVGKPEHKAFLWLAWDIGENVSSLLQLRRCDISRQVDQRTGEPEYQINLRREILKRSRTPRMESTNYRDTVEALDAIVTNGGADDLLFSFGPMNAVLIVLHPLVMVLTVSAAVHLVNYYHDEVRRGGFEDAPRKALRNGIMPCMLATCTTAIGLLSLLLSDIIPIKLFGIYGTCGIIVTLTLLLLTLPHDRPSER